ncbi:unnamed protein product [Coregonus sp. 'balchen']|nr:unnamed protein product [Coregonus sp. 'balchen']
MPVETLRPSDGRLAGVPFTSAMPFRILNKGPDYFRRPAEPGARKLSAVERLEADKAKYVKSQQVVLTRQEPVKPPIIRKPLLSTGMMLQSRINAPPARKFPRRPADSENGGGTGGVGWRRGPPLNLDILNNLINNVCDGPLHFSPSPVPSSPSASSPSSGGNSIGNGLSADQERSNRVLNNLKHVNNCNTSSSSSSSTASPFNNNSQASPAEPSRRPPPVPARGIRMGVPVPYSTPNSVTVRRVDVRPQAEVRKPQRTQLQPQIKPRQTAQPQVAQPQAPTTTFSTAAPDPTSAPHPHAGSPLSPTLPASKPHVSSRGSRPGSARKHPSLHRSKSDLSDRYSRATADLERFFNYCGLHPEEVEGMGGVERFARASSDIVSVSKLRSVSTPSSECERAREQGEDEDEEGPAQPGERVPYGISVIERNARVIKWLYGIRQARDSNAVSNRRWMEGSAVRPRMGLGLRSMICCNDVLLSSALSGCPKKSQATTCNMERSNRVLNNLKHVNNCNTSSSSSASPFNNNSQASPAEPSRRPPPVPARGIRMGVPVPYSTPNSVTVRRVDVRPQAEVRKPQRTQLQPQIKPRQTAQPPDRRGVSCPTRESQSSRGTLASSSGCMGRPSMQEPFKAFTGKTIHMLPRNLRQKQREETIKKLPI